MSLPNDAKPIKPAQADMPRGLSSSNWVLRYGDQVFIASSIALFFSYMFLPNHPLSYDTNFSAYLGSILAAYNPGYLTNDFFVEANRGFGPRFYYAKLLGLFVSMTSVYHHVLTLHVLAKLGLCLSTLFLIGELFPANKQVLAFALVSLFLIEGPELGMHGMFPQDRESLPMSLAIPLSLVGLAFLVAKQPIHLAVCSFLASLIHPNIGVIFGLIMLFTGLICALISDSDCNDRALVRSHLLALLVFVCLFIPIWVAPYLLQHQAAPDSDAVAVLAYRRAPHHLILSYAETSVWMQIGYFFVSSLSLLFVWKKLFNIDTFRVLSLGIILLSVPVLFFVGYFLIEVSRHKLGVVIYPARYMELLRYLGIVLFSGVAVQLITSKRLAIMGLILIAAVCCSYKHLAIVSVALCLLSAFRRGDEFGSLWQTALIASIFLFTLLRYPIMQEDASGLLLLFAFVLLFFVVPARRMIPVLTTLITLVVFMLGIVTKGNFYDGYNCSWFRKRPVQERLSYDRYRGGVGKLARKVRQHTPADALFLIPPHFGHFRVIAERSVLVDFKSFPFQGHAMVQWYRRMNDAYGPLRSGGWGLRRHAIENFRRISDSRLVRLRKKYQIDYAVLFNQTVTNFPVVIRSGDLKVIKLDPNFKEMSVM